MSSVAIILLLLCLVLVWYEQSDFRHLAVAYSSVDKKPYMVLKDREGGVEAADTLARSSQIVHSLADELAVRLRDNRVPSSLTENVKLVIDRIKRKGVHLYELAPDNKTIAYNADKGDMVFVCLRQNADSAKIGDIRVVLYILFHEIAHAMVKDYDPLDDNGATRHSAEFKKCESYLYTVADELNLFKADEIPMRRHCGTVIPLRDQSV